MQANQEVIPVSVINFPDGSTLYLDMRKEKKGQKSENLERIQKCVDIWKSENEKKYKDTSVCSAISSIRMLRSDFDSLPAIEKYSE